MSSLNPVRLIRFLWGELLYWVTTALEIPAILVIWMMIGACTFVEKVFKAPFQEARRRHEDRLGF